MNNERALELLQEAELEILIVFKRFCDENGINWFIDSGTALGARRHSGFIPWDDDVDVAMPRNDYERFLSLALSDFPLGYSVHTSLNTPGYPSQYAKIYKDGTKFYTEETLASGCDQGIFVDVFPYDALSIDPKIRRKQLFRSANAQRLAYLYHLPTVIVPHAGLLGMLETKLSTLAHYLVRPFLNPELIGRYFDTSILRDDSENAETDELICLPFSATVPAFSRDVLLPVSFAKFCGMTVPAPHDIDRYLELLYGDWESIPLESERHTHLPVYLDFGNGEVWER